MNEISSGHDFSSGKGREMTNRNAVRRWTRGRASFRKFRIYLFDGISLSFDFLSFVLFYSRGIVAKGSISGNYWPRKKTIEFGDRIDRASARSISARRVIISSKGKG